MNKTVANVTHLVRLAAIGTATASLAVGGMIPPAQAAVPTCVVPQVTKIGSNWKVKVTNKCSSTYRVKVIWAFALDSPCYQLPPGYYFTSSRSGILVAFDGLKSC
jgi:hypothetical protein